MPAKTERQRQRAPIYDLETEREGRPVEGESLRRLIRVRASGAIVAHDESRSIGPALGHAPFDGAELEAMDVSDAQTIQRVFARHPDITHCIHLAYLMSAEVELTFRSGEA